MTFKLFTILGLLITSVFLIWTLVEYYKIRTQVRNGIDQNNFFPIDRYFELKHQIQYIIAIGSIFTFIFAFMGYNTKEELSKQVHDGISDLSFLKSEVKKDSIEMINIKREMEITDQIIEDIYGINPIYALEI